MEGVGCQGGEEEEILRGVDVSLSYGMVSKRKGLWAYEGAEGCDNGAFCKRHRG